MRSGQRSGAFVHLQNIPARDHVARREVFQDDATRRPQLFGIQLHQVSGLPNGPKTGLAPGPGSTAHFSPYCPGRCECCDFDEHAAAFQIAQDAAHHRSRKANSFPAQQNDQLVLSPARIFAPGDPHGFGLLGRPGRLTAPVRAMGAIFQSDQVVWIVAAPPTVEGLPADAETTAGQSGAALVTKIISHPLQVKLAGPAQLAPKARELSRFRYLPPSNLHGNTLPSVTHHSEREQRSSSWIE